MNHPIVRTLSGCMVCFAQLSWMALGLTSAHAQQSVSGTIKREQVSSVPAISTARQVPPPAGERDLLPISAQPPALPVPKPEPRPAVKPQPAHMATRTAAHTAAYTATPRTAIVSPSLHATHEQKQKKPSSKASMKAVAKATAKSPSKSATLASWQTVL
jgi:hypothetical protein